MTFTEPDAIRDGFHDKDGRSFTLRAYERDLHAPLRAFYEDFEPKRAAQGLPPIGTDRIEKWLSSVLATGIHLLVFRGDTLIGHAMVVPTALDDIGEYAVFIQQAARGRGIGTAVHGAMIEAARGAGVRRLWLTVEPRNRAAIRSYEKVGFRFVPETVFSVEPEMELEL